VSCTGAISQTCGSRAVAGRFIIWPINAYKATSYTIC
jgi:hypothetical protein